MHHRQGSTQLVSVMSAPEVLCGQYEPLRYVSLSVLVSQFLSIGESVAANLLCSHGIDRMSNLCVLCISKVVFTDWHLNNTYIFINSKLKQFFSHYLMNECVPESNGLFRETRLHY